MKSNASNTNSVAKNSSSKRHVTGKRNSANMDTPKATQKTRSRTGHGKANEGTNLSYEDDHE